MDNKVFDFHEIKTFADACEKLGMKEHLLLAVWVEIEKRKNKRKHFTNCDYPKGY